MKRITTMLLAGALLAAMPGAARAVKVDDICKVKGQRVNKLMGLGLVFGLPGTGDGGKYLPAIRPLAATLSKFADPVTVEELKDANNIALVMVMATVPENGVREGDAIDVHVSSIGGAKSLAGGRLFMTPLQSADRRDPTIYAWAEGPLVVEDQVNQRVAVVRQGAVMEAEIFLQFLAADETITLVLADGESGWAMAANIATIINEAESPPGQLARIAVAQDPKNVVVKVARSELGNLAGFISRILNLEIALPPTEARVTINERTGTIIVTGDVEIGPVAISHKGLSITTFQPAPPPPTAAAPQPVEQTFVAVDSTHEGATKLAQLLEALNQLKVPPEDRIAIVKMIHRTGKLHAELIVE